MRPLSTAHPARPAGWRRVLHLLVLASAMAVAAPGCTIPRWPVEGTIVSPFGVRFRGVAPGIHRGVDIATPLGTEVRAMAGGRVRFAGAMSGYGSVVWIEHGGEVLSAYAHLSTILVSPGEAIRSGQVLGLSGDSGNAGGPHLHFEIWRWGRESDPVALLGGFPPAK